MVERSLAGDVTNRLLGGMDPELQRIIIAEGTRTRLRPAQVLYRTGEPAEFLYLLVKGRVQLSRPSRAGREVLFSVLGAGDVLGLVCLLTRRAAYMGTAKTIDTGDALAWDRTTLHRLSRGAPQLVANALTVALGFVAQFADRHEALVEGTAAERLARALSHLGTHGAVSLATGIEIRIKNDELAGLADVSAFTTSRVLQQWERDGAIKKGRGVIRIMNPDGLLPH